MLLHSTLKPPGVNQALDAVLTDLFKIAGIPDRNRHEYRAATWNLG